MQRHGWEVHIARGYIIRTVTVKSMQYTHMSIGGLAQRDYTWNGGGCTQNRGTH